MKEVYKALGKQERALLRYTYKLIDNYIREMAGLVASGEMGPRTFGWQTSHIQEQANNIANMLGERLKSESLEAFKLGFLDAYKTTFGIPIDVPLDALMWYDTNFKTLQDTVLKNYAGDLARLVENAILVGIATGTPSDTIAKTLSKQIAPTAKRRIDVLARDQLSLAMQNGTWQTYSQHRAAIKAFEWIGPDDHRTTVWCRNRKRITSKEPWTSEQVDKYIAENPLTLKGMEIRSTGGTFLHPHIQCRHRLIAIAQTVKVTKPELKI